MPEVNLSAMSGYLAPSNMAETQFDDDETGEYDAEQDSEESLIGYCFFRGFDYKEIILLLLKNHRIEMSLRTLKRRIKSYGLRDNNQNTISIRSEHLSQLLLTSMDLFKGTGRCGTHYS